ncbi:protein vav isoform X2 [Cimex lectularius]|nr:protein vav isoform X2 [Cimex lectularius]XP_024086269.1 protein vav isoform X2 [Cimex lectularius]
MKESDLFEPSMLFELTDLYRVIHTLSKLSNSPKLQRHNIEGFSIHKPRTLSQEDIYRNLNSSGGEEGACAVDKSCVEFAHYDTQIRNEEIYQDLCCIDKHSTPVIYAPTTINHSFEKRDYVINELVETEKNYIDVLNTLLKHFIRPLTSIIKDDDMKTIFGGIKELYEIHMGFHIQLLKAVTPGSGFKLSEAFLNWREQFLVYGEYCANLTKAQSRIVEISRNEIVNQKLIKCQQEANNGKFKLRDILSVPMQRILKYHLLLEKLISETQPNHEDFRGLERAREAMVDVAQYINEVKRDSDTLQIMADIEESITDWESKQTKLTNFGRLLKDGDLRIKDHHIQKIKPRYVFIFDRVMILCKAVRDQYSFKACLSLADFKVEDASCRKTLHRDARWNYHWYLVRKSESTAYTLYARTEDLKRKWIKAIQDALDNIEPAGCRSTDHNFSMHTFDKPTTCTHCSKFLKGIIFQGYKCEKCNLAAHKMCIVNTGRCGSRQPPELPPRPDKPEQELSVHPIVPKSTSDVFPESCRTWTDHGELVEYLWFVGEMGREKASRLLESQVDGTYLLRIRPQGATHPNETVYALSLKADDKVKHMKVYEKEKDGTTHFYLSESRFFPSLVELINCYEHTSLIENFNGLDVCLRWPFRRIIAVADFDFNPAESNQLPLRQGCQVIILSKEGDHKGWWKGMIQDRVGFFPKVYVREVSDTLQNSDLL